MHISPTKARRLAKTIRRKNKLRSYRQIVKDDYPILKSDGTYLIKPGTLNRIATSLKHEGVQWYPKKDPAILLALGLIKPRKPRIIKRLEDHTRDELIDMRDRYARKLEHIDTLIGDPS